MARKRMIDPHIWEDPSFNNMNYAGRVLFIGMISNADDEGYLRGDPGSLKRLVFGFDDISIKEMIETVNEVTKMKNIHFFTKDGELYTHFLNWEEFQKQQKDRISPSVYPKCPTCNIALSDVLNDVDDGKGVVGNLPLRVKVAKRDKMCRYCGSKFPSGGIKFVLEHIIPGGETSEDNCVLACQSCNTKKSGRTPEEAGMKLLPLEVDTNSIQDVSSLDTKVKLSKDKLSKLNNIPADKPQVSTKSYERIPEEKRTELQRAVYFLEDTLDTKIVNWGKQAKAHAAMKKAGYNEKQILYVIKQMANEEFYQDKGFDLQTVANNIAQYKAKARKGKHVLQPTK